MAKQTFTTGQVLLASQLTSLQQTAMLGGAASAKTASYTLVAADAGTAISMTSTSATTITVNTGLFAAGDTVFIQNLGSGNLTLTAGTATVATAGSLILPQNDAGILYFVSTSSSVFYDFIQVGAASPLTTKGDLYTFSTSDTRLGVGANGTTLVADSSEATGLKWQAPAAASRSYAIFSDEKANGTDGGTFTQDAYRTRDLQTTQVNNITGCSLASNQITLTAGTYFVIGRAPAFSVNRHSTRLQNTTDSTTTIVGAAAFATSSSGWSESFFMGQFTITATKVFEIQHFCSATKATEGFGSQIFGGGVNIYTNITIEKIG